MHAVIAARYGDDGKPCNLVVPAVGLPGRSAGAALVVAMDRAQVVDDVGDRGEIVGIPGPSGPARTLAELQTLLNAFTSIHNTRRPHRSLPHRATPATAYAARPKAAPGDRTADTHHRVCTDRGDTDGKLTLRVSGRLHHIGTGREHARTPC